MKGYRRKHVFDIHLFCIWLATSGSLVGFDRKVDWNEPLMKECWLVSLFDRKACTRQASEKKNAVLCMANILQHLIWVYTVWAICPNTKGYYLNFSQKKKKKKKTRHLVNTPTITASFHGEMKSGSKQC